MNRNRFEAVAGSMAAVTIKTLNDALSLGITECEEADAPLTEEQEAYLRTAAMQMCDGLMAQHRDMLEVDAVIEENRGSLRGLLADREWDAGRALRELDEEYDDES